MANLDVVNVSSTYCRKCGLAYNRLKGYFPVCYGYLYKGAGYLPYCRSCVDDMYNEYLAECDDPIMAARQLCRKLDLYWNKALFDSVLKQSTNRSAMTGYITKINAVKYVGKSYDDTLKEEGTMWKFAARPGESSGEQSDMSDTDVSDEVVAFWGPGYTAAMYRELEQRYHYLIEELDNPNPDIGTKILIRQIVNLEIDINKDRAAGKIPTKAIDSLNSLLGSAKLKPAQKDANDASLEKTTFGEWIQKWEEGKPVPEADPELQDVDGIKRYISIWFFGHLCKTLGIKNVYSKMYEDEIAKMRVDKPEYDEEDDDAFLDNVLGSGQDE